MTDWLSRSCLADSDVAQLRVAMLAVTTLLRGTDRRAALAAVERLQELVNDVAAYLEEELRLAGR